MKRCLYLVLATVLLVGAFGVSGCGGGTGISPFLDMLKLIPDTPETRNVVYISDYARIRDIYDVPLPSTNSDDEAIFNYIVALLWDATIDMPRAAGESFISGIGPRQYAEVSPIRRQNIGFGPQDVDVNISAGYPPLTFEAIKGDFDLDAIEDALSQYDESVSPDTDSYHGVTLYIWSYQVNETFQYERFAPPVFDYLGRGTTLAVQEDYIFNIDTPELVKTMIDASQGREDSLADNPDFSLMAEALSEMGAYSCFLTDQVMCVDDESLIELMAFQMAGSSDMSTAELVEQIDEDVVAAAGGELLSVFRTFATGIGEDDKGPFMAIVFIYDSPEQASSDVDVFRQYVESGVSLWSGNPWADRVDSLEVWADGRGLQAKIYGDIARYTWMDIVSMRETLLWCGE